MQNERPIKRRKRGIRASRQKLEKAMRLRGFKTQFALAECIAEQESLETIPKDMVNKVFREVPVSLNTLERVAYALEVEAFSLYLTSEELINEVLEQEQKTANLVQSDLVPNMEPKAIIRNTRLVIESEEPNKLLSNTLDKENRLTARLLALTVFLIILTLIVVINGF